MGAEQELVTDGCIPLTVARFIVMAIAMGSGFFFAGAGAVAGAVAGFIVKGLGSKLLNLVLVLVMPI